MGSLEHDARVVSRLNDLLSASWTQSSLGTPQDMPSAFRHFHVLGPPRSGTTLLMQVLAAGTDLRYINNLVARFWSAPEVGLALSRQVLGDNVSLGFSSRYGRTSHPSSPHEFSYYWRRWLGNGHLDATVQRDHRPDLVDMRQALRQLVTAIGGPCLFKSSVPFHAAEFARLCPEARILYMRRDVRDLAASILRVRQDPTGPYTSWFSLRPNIEISPKASLHEQVALQAVALERHFIEQSRGIGNDRWREVEYEGLCREPRDTVRRLASWLGQDEASLALESVPRAFVVSRGFDALPARDRTSLDAHILRAKGTTSDGT